MALLWPAALWAFPSVSVIDDFNRANNADLGSNWTNPVDNNDCALQIVSNTARVTSTSTDCSEYWNVGNLGPDVEAYATITTKAGGLFYLYCRLQSEGTSGVDGYLAYASDAADLIRLYRLDNNVLTQLATAAQLWADGDALGISCVGTTIQVWRKATGGGSWTLIHSQTDSTYQAAGKVGLFMRTGAGGAVDDFAAGTLSSASAPTRRRGF